MRPEFFEKMRSAVQTKVKKTESDRKMLVELVNQVKKRVCGNAADQRACEAGTINPLGGFTCDDFRANVNGIDVDFRILFHGPHGSEDFCCSVALKFEVNGNQIFVTRRFDGHIERIDRSLLDDPGSIEILAAFLEEPVSNAVAEFVGS